MIATPTQEHLAIQAKPRPVKRFNKAVLVSRVGVVAILVIGAAAYALRPPGAREAQAQELYNTTNKPMPDAFNALPALDAELYQQTYGQKVDVAALMPSMLKAFLASDAALRAAKRQTR